MLQAAAAGETAGFGENELVTIGAVLLLAALLARLGQRLSLPTIPFFMAAGILLGPSVPGIVLVDDPVDLELLASLGLILLLFHLGVEFPVQQVVRSGRRLLLVATVYIVLNVGAGILLGLALGFGAQEALVIGGAVGISSSAIVTKVLIELRRLANAETPVVLGIIVVEDIFLAGYLALLSPIIGGAETPLALLGDIALSFGFLLLLVVVARFAAGAVAAVVHSREDELLVIGALGLVLLVAGTSEELGVSDAIGALMIGLVISRTSLSERVERLVRPLRDAFAAVFFIAFGASIDLGAIGSVLVPALIAGCLTLVLNLAAGVFAARVYGYHQRAAANLGLTLLGRGEFSLILATLAVSAGLDDRLASFIAVYVLLLAVVSPLAAANAAWVARRLPDRLFRENFTYVRGETMASSCTHLDTVRQVEPKTPEGCEECLEIGDTWVHLRLCLNCGHVGCCDDSKNKHAAAHFREEDHPVIQSLEPEESWRWCFVDKILIDPGATGTSGEQAQGTRT
ncbi:MULTISPECIES: cation:proton antiporter [unclassified Blastococcus]|uniref:cation:proton antiporter domain-containing protein n=1 Tax=unclassified Blastococcus TaxID=2619396 RepID=UPI001EEF7BEC|nr:MULTISPECIES: cation:proton antiporter [unclassified Blastococcus]